jgi:CheY-like chemotaxis protein
LIIDDRRDIRFIAEHILSDAGAAVETAADGKTGVEVAAGRIEDGNPFDVVVTDIQMPEMDGYETTKQIRSLGYGGPILALSASAMATDRDKSLAAGCDEHMAKPINRSVFLQMIGKLLDS